MESQIKNDSTAFFDELKDLNKVNSFTQTAKMASSPAEIISHKLTESEKRFETLMEFNPLPFALVRFIDGIILFSNSKFSKLFAISSLDSADKNFYDFLVFREEADEIINHDYSISYLFESEMQMSREDNSFFLGCVSVVATKYNLEDAFMINVVDVTEKKIIEEEKEKLMEELEISREQIEEEAAKMAQINIQLEESELKLKELNAAKDKLFSIIGHDLKNPFFVISSYAQMLDDDYEELSIDEKLQIIHTIGDTSKFAYKLLENLLHWARSQTGRMEFIPEPIQLKKMINNSIQLLSSQAQKKNIIITVDINSALMAEADKNMLDTVLRNLIANAIKFTPEGGSVKVLASESGDFIQISVADSGIGLSESDKTKLFRIDVNNCEIGSSKEKGTGLGLILCKEFIERHGGTIWVESELGKGSEFTFTIPKL